MRVELFARICKITTTFKKVSTSDMMTVVMSIPTDGWIPFSSAIQPKLDNHRTFQVMFYAIIIGGVLACIWIGLNQILTIVIVGILGAMLGLIQEKFFTGPVEFKRVPVDSNSMLPELEIAQIERLKSAWVDLLKPDSVRWVLFSRGTVVLVPNEIEEPEKFAIETLKAHGHVILGTPLADYKVRKLEYLKYLVGYDHPLIYNLEIGFGAAMGELASQHNYALVGTSGRHIRMCDAESLKIVHVENPARS